MKIYIAIILSIFQSTTAFAGFTRSEYNVVDASYFPYVQASTLATVQPGSDGTVRTIVIQPDGKRIVAGRLYGEVSNSSNFISKYASTGGIDSSFAAGAGFNGQVYGVEQQPDGKLVVVGAFTKYQNITAPYIVRLNLDGSIDSSFNVGLGFNSEITGIVIQSDGNLVVVGGFTSVQGFSYGRIARLTTTGGVDLTFTTGTGFDNYMKSISISAVTGKFAVTGGFTSYNSVSKSNIAVLNSDGSLDSTFTAGTGISGITVTTAWDSTQKIVISGSFSTYNGTAKNGIARLNSDGSLDTTFAGSGVNSNILIGHQIFPDDSVLLVGVFSTYNGTAAQKIVKITNTGTIDSSFVTGMGFDGQVNNAIIQADSKVYVKGSFTSYNGTTALGAVRINPDGSIDTTYISSTQKDGKKALMLADDTYVHYDFYNSPGSSIQNASQILRMTAAGAKDTTFINSGTGFDGEVMSVKLQTDGKILVGGSFTTRDGFSNPRLMRLNSDGTKDTTFAIGTGFDGTVTDMAIQSDGKIIVGGYFSTFNGNARRGLVRLTSTGAFDSTYNVNGNLALGKFVTQMVLNASGNAIIIGNFTLWQGSAVRNIIQLTSLGDTDVPGWVAGGITGGFPYVIHKQADGKLIVGGAFTAYKSVAVANIFRANVDGSLDSTFNQGTGFDSWVNGITSDGKNIFIGGNFTSYNGSASKKLVTLNNDGTFKKSFNMNGEVITLTSDSTRNKVHIGGAFDLIEEFNVRVPGAMVLSYPNR